MKKAETKRGRGRPAIPAEARKRNNVTIRLRDDTKAALEKAAAENDRSLGDEIESRIAATFRQGDALTRLKQEPGGPEVYAILTVVGQAMQQAGLWGLVYARSDSDNWTRNPFAYEHAKRAASLVLEALRPPGDATPPEPEADHEDPEAFRTDARSIGDVLAHAALTKGFGKILADFRNPKKGNGE